MRLPRASGITIGTALESMTIPAVHRLVRMIEVVDCNAAAKAGAEKQQSREHDDSYEIENSLVLHIGLYRQRTNRRSAGNVYDI